MSIGVIFFDIGNTLVTRKDWLPGAKQTLAAAKAKGIRVGLISNTGNLDRDQLGKLLPDDFEFGFFEDGLTLLSSEVGVEKPSLSMFLLAIQHAGESPWRVMFVGESLQETLAAQQAGMLAARIVEPKADYAKLIEVINAG